MTQPETAVGGVPSDDTVVASEPTLEERLAATLEHEDEDEDPDAPEAPQEAPEAAEDATEEEPDETDPPAIQPPVSWTAEEKEEFAQLPRALQETLSRREAEREKFVQSKAQEASKVRQSVTQVAVAELKQAQDIHVQQLQALLPAIPDEPSAHLQIQDPYAYAAAVEERRLAIAQHQYVQQVTQQVSQAQQQLEQQLKAQEAEYNEGLLKEHYPEFLDPEQGPELRKSLKSTALALGYSEDQLAYTDAQDILAMRRASEWKAKADKYDTLMAKQMEKVRDAKKLPKVSRPGVAQGKGAIEGQRYAADREAMRRGDKDAAVRVFSKFL